MKMDVEEGQRTVACALRYVDRWSHWDPGLLIERWSEKRGQGRWMIDLLLQLILRQRRESRKEPGWHADGVLCIQMLALVRANPVIRPLSTFEDKLRGSQAHDHHQWFPQGHSFTKEQSQRGIGLRTVALVYSLRSLAHRKISRFDGALRHDVDGALHQPRVRAEQIRRGHCICLSRYTPSECTLVQVESINENLDVACRIALIRNAGAMERIEKRTRCPYLKGYGHVDDELDLNSCRRAAWSRSARCISSESKRIINFGPPDPQLPTVEGRCTCEKWRLKIFNPLRTYATMQQTDEWQNSWDVGLVPESCLRAKSG